MRGRSDITQWYVRIGLLIVVATLLGWRFSAASTVALSEGGDPRFEPSSADASMAFDPLRTAYVMTSGAGGDLPGCGALTAIDVERGEVLYQSPRHGSRGGLSAAEDFSAFASGGGAGPDRLFVLDARSDHPESWSAREMISPSGPRRILGPATAILDGDLWFGASGGTREGKGVGRIPFPWDAGGPDRQDVNPVADFFSVRNHSVAQILPDPNGRSVYLLSHSHRMAESSGEVIKEHALRLHVLDRTSMAAHEASIELPPLVVDEPPGAGRREVGVHSWTQNGRLAYAALLTAGPGRRGPQARYAVANRWLRPELSIVNLDTKSGSLSEVVTASLPADYHITGAIAASRGPHNTGLVAVHGGDKIGIFDIEPYAGLAEEKARIEITPVVSSLTDDRRTMSGPIAWSADGSHLIAAGNEGNAEVLVISVEDCGASLTLRHAVAACPYEEYNGLTGIVTAHGSRAVLAATDPDAQLCPDPFWLGEPWGFDTPYLLSLPWLSQSP